MITIRAQAEAFDAGAEASALSAGRTDIGAIVTFTGLVRGDDNLHALTLEHYPAMTERAMAAIAAEAWGRWPLAGGTVIHRFGRLLPGDPIVLVVIASTHRGAAFEAAEFLMDWLKTRAPFWKHEDRGDTQHWVAAKASDDETADRWER